MEESVWFSFGIIIAIIAIAIVVSLVIDFQKQGDSQAFFEAARQLAREADTVCKMPKDTQLSATITVRSGSTLSTIADAICAQDENERRCFPVVCDLTPRMLLNLTSEEAKSLFTSHDYTCTALRGENVTIICSG